MRKTVNMIVTALVLMALTSSLSFAQDDALSTAKDKDRAAASKIFDEAVTLHGQGTPESIPQAIKKYEEAIRLWNSTGNPLEEARALNNLAALYYVKGEPAKAISMFERVLSIFTRNHSPDHIEVGKTLNNMALVYSAAGDEQKADAMYDRSLPISEIHNPIIAFNVNVHAFHVLAVRFRRDDEWRMPIVVNLRIKKRPNYYEARP